MTRRHMQVQSDPMTLGSTLMREAEVSVALDHDALRETQLPRCGNCGWRHDDGTWCDAPLPYSVVESVKQTVRVIDGIGCPYWKVRA